MPAGAGSGGAGAGSGGAGANYGGMNGNLGKFNTLMKDHPTFDFRGVIDLAHFRRYYIGRWHH